MSQMTHGGHLFLMLFIFTRPHNPFQNQFWRIKMTKIRPSAFRIFIVGSSLAILLCVLSVMMLNTRPAYAGGSACDNVTMDSIKKHTPVPPADIISKRQTFGMCEVILKIGTNLIPLYVADNYVIAGEIYSNKTQVTQATLDKLNSVSAEETKKPSHPWSASLKRLLPSHIRPRARSIENSTCSAPPGAPTASRPRRKSSRSSTRPGLSSWISSWKVTEKRERRSFYFIESLFENLLYRVCFDEVSLLRMLRFDRSARAFTAASHPMFPAMPAMTCIHL